MLVDFLFELRRHKLKVSTHEWQALMEALALGLHDSSLDGFYHLARAVCVKDISEYDAFDQAFLAYFKDVKADALQLTQEMQKWLADPRLMGLLTEEQRQALQAMDLDKLRELFEQRLKEQKGRHDGGNRWIGTGGTSPFGNSGVNPSGVRV
ncbi:MAG: VWA containing CoxE family protein, partial [Kofleriaceae bacterium]